MLTNLLITMQTRLLSELPYNIFCLTIFSYASLIKFLVHALDAFRYFLSHLKIQLFDIGSSSSGKHLQVR